MNDQFLEEMRADWRRSDIDPSRMLENLERRERRLRLLLAVEATSGAVAFVAAIWCGWRAASDGNALFGFASLALLCSAALTFRAMLPSSKSQLEEGPFELLQRTQRNLNDLERAVARWRWSAWILLGCALAIWLFHAVGQTDLPETALLSAAWAGTAAAVAIWSGWRSRQIQRERAVAERLLAEYMAADA